jgi:hypothetical protein
LPTVPIIARLETSDWPAGVAAGYRDTRPLQGRGSRGAARGPGRPKTFRPVGRKDHNGVTMTV